MAFFYSKFTSFILRLSYLEWCRLFLKLSSCKTSSVGNVASNRRIAPLSMLSWKRQLAICFEVLLSKISVQDLRKMRNFEKTDLRTKIRIGYSAYQAQQNASSKLSVEFDERRPGSTRSIEKFGEMITAGYILTFASRDSRRAFVGRVTVFLDSFAKS